MYTHAHYSLMTSNMGHTTTDILDPLLISTTSSKILATSSSVFSTHRHCMSGEGSGDLRDEEEDLMLMSSYNDQCIFHWLPPHWWSSLLGRRSWRGKLWRGISRWAEQWYIAVRISMRWHKFLPPTLHGRIRDWAISTFARARCNIFVFRSRGTWLAGNDKLRRSCACKKECALRNMRAEI
jgi:hypothetical protein